MHTTANSLLLLFFFFFQCQMLHNNAKRLNNRQEIHYMETTVSGEISKYYQFAAKGGDIEKKK